MHCVRGKSSVRILIGGVSLAGLFFRGVPAKGTIFTWNGTDPATGTNWESSANWTPAGGPPSTNDIAKFPNKSSTYQNPSVNDEQWVLGLDLSSSGAQNYTMNGKGTLHIGSSGIYGPYGCPTWNFNIVADADQKWYMGGGGSGYMEFLGSISGPGRITSTGGPLRLRGDNRYHSGGFTAGPNGGLGVGHTNALGTGALRLYTLSQIGGYQNPMTVTNLVDFMQAGPVTFYSYFGGTRALTFTGPVVFHAPVALNSYSASAEANQFNGPVSGYGFVKCNIRNLQIGGSVSLNFLAVEQGPLTFTATSTGNSIAKGVEVRGGKLVINNTANLSGQQARMNPIVPFDVPAYTLRIDALPTFLDPSAGSGVGMLDVDVSNFMQSPASGWENLYLGCSGFSGVNRTFSGTALNPGAGSTYRLGCGGTTAYSLTLDHPTAGQPLLTGNNNLVVGRNGGGDNYAGYIILADPNTFSGSITVNRGSILRGNTQSKGSPFGDAGNSITLNGGRLDLVASAAGASVTNGDLTVSGNGTIYLSGSGTSRAILSVNTLTLDPSYNSALALNADADLGSAEQLIVRNNPPSRMEPDPAPDILDPHLVGYATATDPYFLQYGANGFTRYPSASEVDVNSATSNDVAYINNLTAAVNNWVTNFALVCRQSGTTLSGAGRIVIKSGGMLIRGFSATTTISVPIQFGLTDGPPVEGVILHLTGSGLCRLTGDLYSSGGLTKYGYGSPTLQVDATGNGNKEHSGLSGKLTILDGIFRSNATGATTNDYRFPNVTAIVLNGGGLQINNHGRISCPITIGPNGGQISGDMSSSNRLTVESKVSGTGLLRFGGTGYINWDGVGNDYSGGSYLALGGYPLTVAPNSSLGSGDVRIVSGPVVFRGQNNIAATARVYQSGTSTMQFQYVGDVTIGSLAGVGGTIMLGPSTGSGTTVLHVGSNNESSEYYGAIRDFATANNRRGALVKEGTGFFALNGSTNYFTGPVTVNGGSLLVNGNLVGGVAAQVTVNSGATLGGCGVIRRSVTVNSGGALAPGNDAVGTLTVVGNVTFASAATNRFELGSVAASDKVEVTGDLTFAAGSTLVIDAEDGFGEGVYTLFTYTGSLTWNAPEVVAPENYKGVLSHTGTTGPGEVRLTVQRLKGSMLLIR